jgi:hypothetical protein
MRRPDQSLTRAVLPVLVLVALIGYLAGHGHSGGAPTEAKRTASAGSVLLAYPPGWRTARTAPAIPGLTIAHAVVLAPNGDAAHVGLVAGQLPAGEPSVLPRPFVASMRTFPETNVVNLVEVNAFRYSRLSIPGYGLALTLYAVPSPAGPPTIIACYASGALLADMRTCQQIVDTLTLTGQAQTADLTPNAAYARGLSTAIRLLDERRGRLRRELALHAAGASMQRLATGLAAVFADTAASLSPLEPSFIAGRAQSALIESIRRTQSAYTALAAATEASPAGLAAARAQVYKAEGQVNEALESFAFLGYEPG